ncbi:MAG TPA: hypothetical protein DE315_08965 [Candidatus Omnitrophica bacterium]|nr:hypothetical protein [Candidatus Omnitrophota bacterium]HCI45639.1 hypothetical protein [Candidatus Omnitrophota bacterium]
MLREMLRKLGFVGATLVFTATSILFSVGITSFLIYLFRLEQGGLILVIATICPSIIAPVAVGVFARLSERLDQSYQALDKVKRELEGALVRVKQLKGLLPICAYCKKIRDDQGYWKKVEAYIQENSEAEFTHGICPDCVREQIKKDSEGIRDTIKGIREGIRDIGNS